MSSSSKQSREKIGNLSALEVLGKWKENQPRYARVIIGITISTLHAILFGLIVSGGEYIPIFLASVAFIVFLLIFEDYVKGGDGGRRNGREERIHDLEKENARLREENRRLAERIDKLEERNDELNRVIVDSLVNQLENEKTSEPNVAASENRQDKGIADETNEEEVERDTESNSEKDFEYEL